jgi:hypothetical protein
MFSVRSDDGGLPNLRKSLGLSIYQGLEGSYHDPNSLRRYMQVGCGELATSPMQIVLSLPNQVIAHHGKRKIVATPLNVSSLFVKKGSHMGLDLSKVYIQLINKNSFN